jgi:tyrosine-protein phosphatase SIW14
MRISSRLAVTVPRAVVVSLALLLASPPAWGAPDKSDVPVERFHRVDEGLYRGAQPTAEGFRRLRDLGVRTIVNLRMEADAKRTNEKQIVEGLGMRYIHLPVEDGNFFTRSRRIPDDVIRDFFKVLDQSDGGPVFLHCHRGADRTGALIAFYRIARHGWDNQRALQESRAIGMRSWYRGLQDQIVNFSAAALQLIRPAGSQ